MLPTDTSVGEVHYIFTSSAGKHEATSPMHQGFASFIGMMHHMVVCVCLDIADVQCKLQQ